MAVIDTQIPYLRPVCSIRGVDAEPDLVEFQERHRRQAAGAVATGSPVACGNAWTGAGADVCGGLMAALDEA